MHPIFVKADAQAVPILFVTDSNFAEATTILDQRERAFVRAAGFEPKPGKHLIVPDAAGKLAGVLFGLEEAGDQALDLFRPGALAGLLPAGSYRFANAPHDARLAALGSVEHVTHEVDETVLYTLDAPAAIGELLALADQSGVTGLDVAVRRPTLEDVFLELTGRALRD